MGRPKPRDMQRDGSFAFLRRPAPVNIMVAPRFLNVKIMRVVRASDSYTRVYTRITYTCRRNSDSLGPAAKRSSDKKKTKRFVATRLRKKKSIPVTGCAALAGRPISVVVVLFVFRRRVGNNRSCGIGPRTRRSIRNHRRRRVALNARFVSVENRRRVHPFLSVFERR